jgi:hypothetical protein
MNQPEYPKSKYNNSIAGAALSIGVKPETLELFVNQMREYDRAQREGDKPDSKLVYWWAYVEVYNTMQELSKKVKLLDSGQNAAIAQVEMLNRLTHNLVRAGDAMAAIIKPPAHGTGEWDGEYDNWMDAKEGREIV